MATAVKKFLIFMDFSARTPVADYNISSYKTACDIHLKPVFLAKLGLWRNPAPKLHEISFRFLGYHNIARTVVILNVSIISIIPEIYLHPNISTLSLSEI